MSFYSITPLSGQMLVKDNTGETSFTVTNTTDRALQTRFDLGLEVESPAKKEWLQVMTKPCYIVPLASVQVLVKMKAPPGTQGSYNFCIVAAAAPRTDEDFTVGPTISFSFGKATIPTPQPTKIKWWMILIGAVVLLGIVGGVVALVTHHHAGVPDVVGKKTAEATDILQQAGFKTKVNEAFYKGKDPGIVQKQVPTPSDPAPQDKTVSLDVSSSMASVPCVETMQFYQASVTIKAAGLEVGDQSYTSDGTAANNTIVSQNPRNEVCTPHASGLKVMPGTKVNLVIKR